MCCNFVVIILSPKLNLNIPLISDLKEFPSTRFGPLVFVCGLGLAEESWGEGHYSCCYINNRWGWLLFKTFRWSKWTIHQNFMADWTSWPISILDLSVCSTCHTSWPIKTFWPAETFDLLKLFKGRKLGAEVCRQPRLRLVIIFRGSRNNFRFSIREWRVLY